MWLCVDCLDPYDAWALKKIQKGMGTSEGPCEACKNVRLCTDGNPKRNRTEENDMTDAKQTLEALAIAYTNASGTAYARGDDTNAALYREAARKLRALIPELPAVPVTKR
jgi:hypothetical protein